MANKANQWAKKTMSALRIEFGARCAHCGLHLSHNKINLEFAHIHDMPSQCKGQGRGRKERISDIKGNRSSYRLLCDKCHKEYDTNKAAYIALDKLFSQG